METINATRMALLLKREELKAASTGAELLRNKRDVLTLEFFSTLKPLMAQRNLLDEQANQASMGLALALGQEGKEKINSFSFTASRPIGLEIVYKNLLGLKIPEILVESAAGEGQQGLTRLDASLAIEELKVQFTDLLMLALRILPQELKLKRLGQEIKNTTRKVNSLEKFVIPQLYSQIKSIREALEEREREDIFRLKRLKKREKDNE